MYVIYPSESDPKRGSGMDQLADRLPLPLVFRDYRYVGPYKKFVSCLFGLIAPAKVCLYKQYICQRPICPACIMSNPRLSRYDPCLACLAGVSVVASSGSHCASGSTSLPQKPWSPGFNLSESEGAFILGDDDDDLDESEVEVGEKTTDNCDALAAESVKNVVPVLEVPPFQEPSRTLVPYKYYLNRSDTLHGLSLRFGINVSLLIPSIDLFPQSDCPDPRNLQTQ